jgi:hypothetical protein
MKAFVLISLAAIMVGVTGCKSDDPVEGLNEDRVDTTRSAIQSTVPDAALRGKMIAVVGQFEVDLNQIGDSIKQTRAAILKANAEYTTDRATLEKMYAKLGDDVRQLGRVLRDRNMELRELCTAEQWDDIADDNDPLVNFVF